MATGCDAAVIGDSFMTAAALPNEFEAESTVQQLDVSGKDAEGQEAEGQEACLVQIYPADVIDGMLLLNADELTIGRDFECDVILGDSSVSRRHAVLERGDQGYHLRDLGSTNGTWVQGERVADRLLASGDRISIGSFIFKFLSAGCVESQYHETVYQSLVRDALTGAMNKRYLLDSMRRELARSRRGGQPLSVVMIDIDYFKQVNDTHGHLVGDQVLREFGARLQAICREDDLLARYGGEEFCLVLASTDHAEASEIAERCRQCVIESPIETAVGPLPITASFGVACRDASSPESLDTPNGLLALADQWLYTAKHRGRDQVAG